MFAEAAVPRAETAPKPALAFAPWASSVSAERVWGRVEGSSRAAEEVPDTATS